VFGYHLTENCNGSASPTMILVEDADVEILYAVPAAMTPGSVAFGAACSRTLRCDETCRWLNCKDPVSAMMRGM